MAYFNSIKVRLKPSSGIKRLLDLLFQFHKGTIKTQQPVTSSLQGQRFQFHKGTIKTIFLHKNTKIVTHFNSIKVRLKQTTKQRRATSNQFQFHKGTIKTELLTL